MHYRAGQGFRDPRTKAAGGRTLRTGSVVAGGKKLAGTWCDGEPGRRWLWIHKRQSQRRLQLSKNEMLEDDSLTALTLAQPGRSLWPIIGTLLSAGVPIEIARIRPFFRP